MSTKNTIKSGVKPGDNRPGASDGSPAPSANRPQRTISSPVPSSAPAEKPKTMAEKPKMPSFDNIPSRPAAPVSSPAPVPAATVNEAAQRLASVRSNWERVAGLAALASLFDSLENVSGNVAGLDAAIAELRGRGYRFARGWEARAQSIRERWPQQRTDATRLLEEQRKVLQSATYDVENLLRRAVNDASLIATAESRISAFESNVRAAESRARGLFDQTEREANALRSELAEVKFMLDALDTASFPLLPDEHGLAACRATWLADREEPEGLLFLTDARLVFEQRQEIATKKVLFVTTQKELVQKKLWETPIGAVEELQVEDKKAFLSKKELLTLRFSVRTRELPSDVTLELKGTDNETWAGLIRRAKSGQIDVDRFGTADPSEQLAAQVQAEASGPARELPTRCPSCNATLPQVYKGMKQVSCEYCGTVVNI